MKARSLPVVLTLLALPLVLAGCLGKPDGVEPVSGFELDRYLGKWYEIARLDHSFERGLQRVTAEYSLMDDGGVRVVNRGYSPEKSNWKEAQGKAYFVGEPDQGYLKVSFFGPFFGSYVVFDLEPTGYEYAFVSGPNNGYLWLLSRTPEVDEAVMERFLERGTALGFPMDELVTVSQDPAP